MNVLNANSRSQDDLHKHNKKETMKDMLQKNFTIPKPNDIQFNLNKNC